MIGFGRGRSTGCWPITVTCCSPMTTSPICTRRRRGVGRRCPARVLATVMVLQAFEGLSDREATDRLEVDLRWQAAAGVDTAAEAFHPTVLVGQRNRLRASTRPRRLFEDTKVVARQTGVLKDRARVLDSTPLHDAVATQDTVTQLRAAIRKLLAVLDNVAPTLAARVRGVLERDDDYATAGKPPCDWDDPAAREQLVDELVHDALAALAVLDGEPLTGAARDAADLLAIVAGQDVEAGDDGVFRIVRGVARDRVISTVDPQARHGHKSQNRRFDGYKTHASVDPDSELIDEVTVTPANTPDRDAVEDLLADHRDDEVKPEVIGDSAYADGDTRDRLARQGYTMRVKQPPARNRAGRFTKDRFAINLDDDTRDLPSRADRDDHPVTAGRGQGELRRSLRHLSAAQAVHRRPPGPVDHHPPPRSAPPGRPHRAGHPRLGRALPGRPADRGTQDRPLRPTAVGWPQGPMSRPRPASPPTSTPEPPPINLAALAVLGVCFNGAGWTANGTADSPQQGDTAPHHPNHQHGAAAHHRWRSPSPLGSAAANNPAHAP